ncbi:MAG: glycine cleavage system protein GcvH [Alphaproteobacteria bacterium]|nr:glycine cleavage system protein GcvH [Alphaproteobacteria bacterium]
MNIPANLQYTNDDEWVTVEGDIVTVGITDYAQDQLGDLVHVELGEVGRTVAKDEAVCEIESVKTVAEVKAPVAGEVIEVNAALADAAEQINSDPYGSWIFKLRVSAPPTGLLDAAAYQAKIG